MLNELDDPTIIEKENDKGYNIRINKPKPNLVFKLPVSKEAGKKICYVWISPEFDIVIKTKSNDFIKSPFFYSIIDDEAKIDWLKTGEELTFRIKDVLRNQYQLIVKLVYDILYTENDTIGRFIYAVAKGESFDYIKDYVHTPDECDIYDIYDNEKYETIDVSRAIKRNSGQVKVKGAIISMSQPFKLIQSYTIKCHCGSYDEEKSLEVPLYKVPNVKKSGCKDCDNTGSIVPDYVNAISVELQDDEKFNEIERLNCILIDTDISDIKICEKVIIGGSIHIINKNQKGNLVTVLFSYNHLEYQDKNETITNELDIKAIKRFANMNGEHVIPELVKMVDKSIIGLEHAKKCILLSSVSSGDDLKNTKNNRSNRNRLHTLFIGPPGLGKSSLLKKGVKLVSNSRFESSQYSSGKSLTAIVEKDNDQSIQFNISY